MQVLKDEVRDQIFDAALKKFAEKGFKRTTMADIAKEAGLSVGNLYRYYKNKDHIFRSVITPGDIEELISLFTRKIQSTHGIPLEEAGQNPVHLLANDEMIDFYCENRLRLIVALENVEETSYSGVKEKMLDNLVSLFYQYLRSIGKEDAISDPGLRILIRTIYINLTNGILGVLRSTDNKEILRQGLHHLLTYHLYGLSGFTR
jgi:AcrR family transcriptional regulator